MQPDRPPEVVPWIVAEHRVAAQRDGLRPWLPGGAGEILEPGKGGHPDLLPVGAHRCFDEIRHGERDHECFPCRSRDQFRQPRQHRVVPPEPEVEQAQRGFRPRSGWLAVPERSMACEARTTGFVTFYGGDARQDSVQVSDAVALAGVGGHTHRLGTGDVSISHLTAELLRDALVSQRERQRADHAVSAAAHDERGGDVERALVISRQHRKSGGRQRHRRGKPVRTGGQRSQPASQFAQPGRELPGRQLRHPGYCREEHRLIRRYSHTGKLTGYPVRHVAVASVIRVMHGGAQHRYDLIGVLLRDADSSLEREAGGSA